MQLHQLSPTTRSKKKRRIGRGGKRGTTSGRGTKGQKSRAGHKIRPAIADSFLKIPKRRGVAFKSIAVKPFVLNVGDVAATFNDGDTVSPKVLHQKKIMRFERGKLPTVKILGGGVLKKKLVFEHCLVSSAAREKIVAAGGSVKAQ